MDIGSELILIASGQQERVPLAPSMGSHILPVISIPTHVLSATGTPRCVRPGATGHLSGSEHLKVDCEPDVIRTPLDSSYTSPWWFLLM